MKNKMTVCVRNNIAKSGLDLLQGAGYKLVDDFDKCHAVLLRSYKLADTEVPDTCLAVARAGVGVNNVPVEQLARRGIPVFNTPGANANSVKELVIAGMLLASRPIAAALDWMKEQESKESSDIHERVEKEKKRFAGSEILGKKLGVIGLGAIGVQVANAAVSLGMQVAGYDPFITVHSAWGLSRAIQKMESLERLCAESDYLTLHVPLTERTQGMINEQVLRHTKPGGAVLLNLARGELVERAALKKALGNGKLRRYISDFPNSELLGSPGVLFMPHLGASTAEAEENCARMAAHQLIGFLQRGNIVNSVNFPLCNVEQRAAASSAVPSRITVTNLNVPNIVGQISAILAREKLNILDFTNRHRGDIAYNIIDTDAPPSAESLQQIEAIDGIISTRSIDLSAL